MKKSGIILFGLALLAQPVQAQPWVPDLAPELLHGSSVTYVMSGPSSIATAGWGYWAGPHNAQFISPTTPNVTLYCVDFYTLVANGGRTITAQALSLGEPGTLGLTQRWGSRTYSAFVPLENFKKAAYLASLFPTFAGDNVAVRSAQGAIWALTSGNGPYSSDSGVIAMLAAAEAGWADYGEYYRWSLLRTTAVNGSEYGLSQHFLAQSSIVNPEPQTYVLLGSGLLFLVFVGRRRLKENGYS